MLEFAIGNIKGTMLQLNNLEFLNDKYANKTFKDIEDDSNAQKLVNDIYETEMRFTVINPGTPEAVKRNIFKRINTGGMPLTAQEIRHALYEGKSSELLQKLVKSEVFIQAVGKKIDDSRMGASELILRLIAFMVLDRSSYKVSMDSWLSNAMRVINLFPNPTTDDLKKIFNKDKPQNSDLLNDEIPILKIQSIEYIIAKFELSMNRNKELFDGHAFRKSLPNDFRKSPINKSLFEIWGNVLSELSEEQYDSLKTQKEILFISYGKLLKDKNNSEFTNCISRHSSTGKCVVDGYTKIFDLVNKVINREELL